MNICMSLSFDWLILLFLAVINIVGASLMMIDKRRSRLGQWRIRECTFFVLSFLGGGIGEIAAMHLIRHKTKHPSFVIGLPVITVLFYGLLLYFLFFR
jgi:uncharacterized membrane protein YsdA (DUF1294 family)